MGKSAKRRRQRKKHRVRRLNRRRRNAADQAALEMQWDDADSEWSEYRMLDKGDAFTFVGSFRATGDGKL